MQPLPSALEIKLPRRTGRLRRVVIGVDVVLLDTMQNVILDVIEDALR